MRPCSQSDRHVRLRKSGSPCRVLGVALSYKVEAFNEFFAQATHPDGTPPNLLCIEVPEQRTVKNRMHLDVAADDREAEIERLIELGVTRGDTHTMTEYGITWTVMRDPEGNEVCMGQQGEH